MVLTATPLSSPNAMAVRRGQERPRNFHQAKTAGGFPLHCQRRRWCPAAPARRGDAVRALTLTAVLPSACALARWPCLRQQRHGLFGTLPRRVTLLASVGCRPC